MHNHDDMEEARPVIIGVTGASGAILAKRAVELLQAGGQHLVVTCTGAGREVWKKEMGGSISQWLASIGVLEVDIKDIAAPIASGTYETKGMLVIPCSMGTAAAIAHGLSANLLQRAADVTIKEGRRLVVVPRESPLSVIHLTNLLTLAQAGVKIVMPVPAFYTGPKEVEDIVDAIVERALATLGASAGLSPKYRYQDPER